MKKGPKEFDPEEYIKSTIGFDNTKGVEQTANRIVIVALVHDVMKSTKHTRESRQKFFLDIYKFCQDDKPMLGLIEKMKHEFKPKGRSK